MAIFKLAPGAISPVGSVQGSTFQYGPAGNSIKNKSQQKQWKSYWQLVMQTFYLDTCRQWKKLLPADRTWWTSWKDAYPQYSKAKKPRKLSAYNVFVKRNFYRWIDGELPGSYMVAPVFVEYLEDLPAVTPQVSPTNIILVLAFPRGNGDLSTIIFVSAGKSAGRSFADHSWRLMQVIPNISQSIDITAIWCSKFDKIPVSGTHLFCSIFQAGIDNGQFWFHNDFVIGTEPIPNVRSDYFYNCFDLARIAPPGWHIPDYYDVYDYFATLPNLEEICLSGIENWNLADWGSNPDTLQVIGTGIINPATGILNSFKDTSSFALAFLTYIFPVYIVAGDFAASYLYGSKIGVPLRFVKDDNDPVANMVGNDGKLYPTVEYLGKIWSRANSQETLFNDLTPITQITVPADWVAATSQALCIITH